VPLLREEIKNYKFGMLLVTQKFAVAFIKESSELNANFWEHRTTAGN
jgi:hypothetical protein